MCKEKKNEKWNEINGAVASFTLTWKYRKKSCSSVKQKCVIMFATRMRKVPLALFFIGLLQYQFYEPESIQCSSCITGLSYTAIIVRWFWINILEQEFIFVTHMIN